MNLSGKVAVVTGGTRGIGKAIADLLTEYGAEVHARDKGYCDLSKNIYIKTIGQTDILINNACYQIYKPAVDFTPEDWERMMNIGVSNPFRLCQAAYKAGCKRIINIASTAGIRGTRNTIGYSVAKAALIHMTKCLSNEWAESGCTVNAIAPGYIDTDMLKPLMEDTEHAQKILDYIPAHKWGTPQDVANAVLFLCSDEAQYITGQTLIIDGGWTAR